MTSVPLILVAVLAVFAAPPAGARPPAAPRPPGQAPSATAALRAAKTPAELRARDARLGFLPSSAVSATRVLAGGELDGPGRSAALLALGSGGGRSERERLESWATTGTTPERRAAILALGELGAGSAPFLLKLLASEGPAASDAIALALLRTGASSALEGVRAVAEGGGPLADIVGPVREYHVDPDNTPVTAVHREFLELRWEAARRHGLIDGRSWSVLLVDELCRNDQFLDLCVLRSVAKWHRPGVHDHLLEVLLTGTGIARILAAVEAMPVELDQLVQTGLWQPRNPGEWNALVLGVDEAGVAQEMRAALSRATSVGAVRQRALTLLIEVGSSHAGLLIEAQLGSRSPATRAWIAESLGASGDTAWLSELDRMRVDPQLRVRSAALVAQARLESASADIRLHELISGRVGVDEEERTRAMEALADVGDDPRLRGLMEAAFAATDGRLKLRLAVILARLSRPGAREYLREALSTGETGRQARRAVLALAVRPDGRDIDVLSELFPVEGDLGLNAELGRALIDAGAPEGLVLLRAALWRGPWNRSVLAAGLLVRQRGISGLREELDSPPLGIGSRARRRVGFALGQWGGLQELEHLARDRRPGDPAVSGAYLGALGARTH